MKVIVAFILLCAASSYASAEIIEDIKLKTDANGEVDAVVKFTVPIQKLRYFPTTKSQYVVVFFNILDSVPRDKWQDYESHRSPPSDIVVGFTVTTRDLNTGPKIEIQFNRPAEFRLTYGRDNRSLMIHIKPDRTQPSNESKPVPVPPAGILAPPSTPPVIAAPPTAALPEASVTVTAPSAAVPAPVQLGGKDGLPAFPKIEAVVQTIEEAKAAVEGQATGEIPPAGEVSLADQIKKANSEAAVQMAKGRDALLAGEIFSAIEAFNNTLKLPANKYSSDAQLWIGIAREKSGQQAKAKLEYESYIKLYPNGTGAKWVTERLARLAAIMPAPSPLAPQPATAKVEKKDFQTTAYGSFSQYYYHGASHTDTIATVGAVQSPTSLTVTDQSSLITNVSMTARTYNDEFDNRLVFQDFLAANFLPGQKSKNRLNAAFFEVKNRPHDYSARFGRQSAMGGGVLGRFDGVYAGYGFLPNWRANVVAGQLSDFEVGAKPRFRGASMDFGIRNPLGGSLYTINQTVGGIADRKAVGGNLRYFDPEKTAIAMVDYDTQFRTLNMVTMQGTLIGQSGTDYNFLVDIRKTPSLSIRSAVNGTTASVEDLLQNGFTMDDLQSLAKKRTATSNSAQVGMTNHIKEKWQMGTDLTVANTSGMPESGTQISPTQAGLEGYLPATPSSGNTWTLSERLIGNDVLSSRDVSMLS